MFELPAGEKSEAVPVQKWELVENHIKATITPLWNWRPDTRGRSLRGYHDNQPCRFAGEIMSDTVEGLVAQIIADPLKGWQYPEPGTEYGRLRELAGEVGGGGDVQDFEAMLRKWLETFGGTMDATDDWQRRMQEQADRLKGSASPQVLEDSSVVRLVEFWTNKPDPWYILTAGRGAARSFVNCEGRITRVFCSHALRDVQAAPEVERVVRIGQGRDA